MNRLLVVTCAVVVATAVVGCFPTSNSTPSCFFGSDCAGDAGGTGSSGGSGSGSQTPLICAPQASHAEPGNAYCSQLGSIPCNQGPNCCCESGSTCLSQYQNSLGPDYCSFCYFNDDPRFVTFCGLGAANYPNYCPADTTCVHETSVTNSAITYGCCPAGMTCAGVEGFDVCKM